jgi:hypothetical protein
VPVDHEIDGKLVDDGAKEHCSFRAVTAGEELDGKVVESLDEVGRWVEWFWGVCFLLVW